MTVFVIRRRSGHLSDNTDFYPMTRVGQVQYGCTEESNSEPSRCFINKPRRIGSACCSSSSNLEVYWSPTS